MTKWPHEAIYVVATWYIRQASMGEAEWRYTRLGVVHEPLESLVSLAPDELSIVSCFINADAWFVMTSARIEIGNNYRRYTVNPLEITCWDWGDFKTELQPERGTALLTMNNGDSLSLPYETGYASMAPIYYERFWQVKYPALDKLDLERIRCTI